MILVKLHHKVCTKNDLKPANTLLQTKPIYLSKHWKAIKKKKKNIIHRNQLKISCGFIWPATSLQVTLFIYLFYHLYLFLFCENSFSTDQ